MKAAQLKAAVADQLPELVAIRRHLHAHPELSGNEHQTAALVAGELRSLGWRVQEGVAAPALWQSWARPIPPRANPRHGLRCGWIWTPFPWRSAAVCPSLRCIRA